MSSVGIKGRFRCVRALDGQEGIFDNTITPEGLERIVALMGGLSTGVWDSIRLVSADPTIFVQKLASITQSGTTLKSTAVFPASELVFATVSIQMYADGVKVAEAPASLQAGLTYYVTREDILSQGV